MLKMRYALNYNEIMKKEFETYLKTLNMNKKIFHYRKETEKGKF